MKKHKRYAAVIVILTLMAGVATAFSCQGHNGRDEIQRLEELLEEQREQNRVLEERLERAEERLEEWEEKYREMEEEKLYWLEKYQETREENSSGNSGDGEESGSDRVEGGAPAPGGRPPSGRGQVAYLTFDDGPSKNTLKVLDILDDYGIKATFFVTGNNESGDSHIYQRILAEGHALGNHTDTHKFHEIYQSPDSFMEDFLRMEEHIKNQTGVRTDIMRFPGGSSSAMAQEVSGYNIIVEDLISKVEKEGYDYFDWNVSSGDGRADLSSAEIVSNALEGAARVDGDLVVLFHDSENRHTTVEALPTIIEEYKARGYRFDVLSPGAVDVKHRR